MVVSVGCSGSGASGSAKSVDEAESTVSLVDTSEGDPAPEEATDPAIIPAPSAASEETSEQDSAASTVPSQSNFPEMTAEEAQAQGYDQLFEGTVRVMDIDESLEMLGLEGGVGMFDGECVALMFDSPVEVTATSAAGFYTNTQEAVLLGLAADMASSNADDGDVDLWRDLDGQRCAIAVNQDDMWYPTEINPFGDNPVTQTESIVIVK